MAYKALDIANKLLYRAAYDETDELMTHLKLQKMLYYEQGYHLAVFGTPLFNENVEAWMYGPVVPEVYEHFKDCKKEGLSPESCDQIALLKKEEALFEEVYMAYKEFSAYGLMRKTHKESPWLKTTPKGPGHVITHTRMSNFFKTQLANG